MKLHNKIQITVQRTCCFLLTMMLFLTCLPFSVLAKEKTSHTIRVGSFEGTYNVVDEKGERRGYGYEFLQAIAGYSGWSYEYVNSTWKDCFYELEKGNIDILGGISYTEERAEKMLFSDMPMGEERYYIYTNTENDDLSASRVTSFAGKNIGVLEGYIPEEMLVAWEKKNHLIMNHVNISTVEEILDKMAKHEIDCFVSVEEKTWADLGISPVTGIGESSIYFVIRKDRPDIKATLDNAMHRIKDDNPFYADELYKRYLSTQCSTFLSQEEKDWIAEHGTIKIGYLNNDIGVSVKHPETGELTGIITDYVELAKNSLQGQILDFETKGYDTRNQQLEALHNGDIDLIFHVSQNPYSAETNGFVLSDTVWTFHLAAITTKTDFDENNDNVVGVSKDNFALKAYISYNYPQWLIEDYETRDEAYKAMLHKNVDCILRNSSEVSDIINNKTLHSFFLTKPADASFAIRQGEPILLSILNKTLMSIPNSKLSGAMLSYSNAMRKVTVADFLKDNAWNVFVVVMLIIIIICIFLIKSIFSEKKAKRLLKEANSQSEIIGSISKIYSFIYQIDLRNGIYEEVSPDTKIKKIAGAKGLFEEAKTGVIQMLVAEEYRQIMEQFMELSTISDRLRDIDNLYIEYKTPQNTWQMAQFIVKNRDENGQVTEILYTVRQIDKQKQLENKYKQKLLFHNRVLTGLSTDYTIAFVLNLDTDSYKIAFNQSTNHAKQENNITSFREYVDQYAEHFVLPEFQDGMRQALHNETIKKRFITEDDYHFYFETTPNAAGLCCFQAHIVKEYEDGEHFAFLGFRSVDDAIRQEKDYKKMLQNQLNLITSSLPGGVKISNDDSTYSFKYVSEQFATMLGYTSAEELMDACGGSIAGLAHPDDLNVGIADALDQYSRADHYATTYRMRCKDGSYKYIEDRGQKVITPNGVVEHWNLILDKNDLMEKTIALESEKKANQSKTDFLARMSHDMRTPLNGIIGMIKINQDHFGDAELVRENYRKMKISADHLLSLINDVLQMSKIEDGVVPLTNEVIDFRKLSGEIVAIVEQRAAERGIKLNFIPLKEDLFSRYVYGSPLHLRQIFLNIYSNSIKYNRPNGSINTSSDYERAKDGRYIYEWVISDTGIGMSKEFLEHIFEPFVQEKNDARSVYQGTGLGMPIVKGLVEKMGGTIKVDSQKGVGSTFTIRIPFEIADVLPDQSAEEYILADIQGLKILLVEDNEMNAEIAQTILEDAGAVVTLKENGKEALETFENSEEGTFDAILMDIMMPVMNGYEATEAIRNLKRPDAKKIPIIALTANAFAEDAKKCMDCGMNAHLSKPLEMGKFEKTICEQVRLSKKNS